MKQSGGVLPPGGPAGSHFMKKFILGVPTTLPTREEGGYPDAPRSNPEGNPDFFEHALP